MANQGYRYEASWGGIRIDVTSSRISHGRNVVAHKFPKRDGADTEDMGRDEFRCDLSFIFIDRKAQPGEATPIGDFLARFLEFDELVAVGAIRTLIHPYEGAVRCRLENFTHDADGDSVIINASATFIEDIAQPAVFSPDGAGVQTVGGAQDVRASALTAEQAREIFEKRRAAEAGQTVPETVATSEALTGANEAATRWENDPTLTSREVQAEMAIAINALNADLATLNVNGDIDGYPLLREYTLLQWSLRKTAESFSSTTTRIVTIFVTDPAPLRVIAARFYGADQAIARFSEMLELNPDLKSPVLVPRGTELKAQSPNVEPGTLRR